ncbi:hypothetical protein DSO57_1034415 [Entomophthora muscae]|uniref:Uncharacterized protein n=1 Tax=Entomophthora muscae TaxID=34485 RepID=A0ACC2U9M4_9FUNG|nr:hypothetical protein DSO57_1034415 [Entomophthora muscae]
MWIWWVIPHHMETASYYPSISVTKIEDSFTAIKIIKVHMHQSSVYPAVYADIHLADVVFFNIEDTFWQLRLQKFNDLYLGGLDHDSLFGQQMVADLFAQKVFHVYMGNQSQKNKHLSPHAIAVYQPIKPMSYEKYNKCYMAVITINLIGSTPATITLHLSAPPAQSQTFQASTTSTTSLLCYSPHRHHSPCPK